MFDCQTLMVSKDELYLRFVLFCANLFSELFTCYWAWYSFCIQHHLCPRWHFRMPASFDKRFPTKKVHTCWPINVRRDLEIKRFSFGAVLWRRCFRCFELLHRRNGKAIWDQGKLLVELWWAAEFQKVRILGPRTLFWQNPDIFGWAT